MQWPSEQRNSLSSHTVCWRRDVPETIGRVAGGRIWPGESGAKRNEHEPRHTCAPIIVGFTCEDGRLRIYALGASCERGGDDGYRENDKTTSRRGERKLGAAAAVCAPHFLP